MTWPEVISLNSQTNQVNKTPAEQLGNFLVWSEECCSRASSSSDRLVGDGQFITGPHLNIMKAHKLRRKTVLALRKIFERKQQRQKQKSLNISLSKDCKVQSSNIYVGLQELKKPLIKEIRFKRDISECPCCIFGDSSLTCTCSFKQTVPDFKLYEDEEEYMVYFNSSDCFQKWDIIPLLSILCFFSNIKLILFIIRIYMNLQKLTNS